jgi:hypothetical protein
VIREYCKMKQAVKYEIKMAATELRAEAAGQAYFLL